MKKLLSILTILTLTTVSTTNLVSCHSITKDDDNTQNDLIVFSQIKGKILDKWQDFSKDNGYLKMNTQTELSILDKLHSYVNEKNQVKKLNYVQDSNVFEYIFNYLKKPISNINDSLVSDYSNYYQNDNKMLNFTNSKDNVTEISVNYIKNNTQKIIYLNIKFKVNIKFKKLEAETEFNHVLILSDQEQTPEQQTLNKKAIEVINNYLVNKVTFGFPDIDIDSAPTAIKWFWNNILLPISKNVNLVDFTKDINVNNLIRKTKDIFDRNSISDTIEKSIIDSAKTRGLTLFQNKDIHFYQSNLTILDDNFQMKTINSILHWLNLLNDSENITDVLINQFKKINTLILDYSYFSVSSFLLEDNTPVIGFPTNLYRFFTFVTSDFWNNI